jgi:hypothetical protein
MPVHARKLTPLRREVGSTRCSAMKCLGAQGACPQLWLWKGEAPRRKVPVQDRAQDRAVSMIWGLTPARREVGATRCLSTTEGGAGRGATMCLFTKGARRPREVPVQDRAAIGLSLRWEVPVHVGAAEIPKKVPVHRGTSCPWWRRKKVPVHRGGEPFQLGVSGPRRPGRRCVSGAPYGPESA